MTTPKGFTFGAAAAGLKAGGLDVALIASDRPAVAAGVLTTNRFQAAPIAVTKRNLRDGNARAIVANAGNANACTGRDGAKAADAMTVAAAKALGVNKKTVLVASTGVIGRALDVAAVTGGIRQAAAAMQTDPADVAQAIMTTDTKPKIASASVAGAGILGVAKGAGMIAPEMATMLCFVATDAVVSRAVLSEALRRATASTFNLISVDGCMSTNDCILVLANGASGVEISDPDDLTPALTEVCGSLARQCVADGEGVRKVVAITVRNAVSSKEARVAARRVADSVLLRCAIGGADPNWGRVLAALGTAPIKFDPNVVDVWIGGEMVAQRGGIGPGDLGKASAAMAESEVEIVVDMNRGSAEATMLTNDMTAEYVRINADYTS